MLIESSADLTSFNSLNIKSACNFLITLNHIEDIKSAISFAKDNRLTWLVIGGGSNVVLPEYFNGVVLRNNIRGISRILKNEYHDFDTFLNTKTEALFVAGAGENWHQFVRTTVEQGYGGLENLSLIPGTVGAAPIQNIGAYGVEVADSLAYVAVYDCQLKEFRTLSAADCEFSYRHSVFKDDPCRYIIHHVAFKLSKDAAPNFSYGPLSALKGKESNFSYSSISDEIVNIRNTKLPLPEILPNVGSFFKNPVISSDLAKELIKKNPDIVYYPQKTGVKLAAGWLIEACGWKGFRNDVVGVHDKQALVLVNHNKGGREDILYLAKRISESVYQKFKVMLEIEPRVVA